ncbi:MAG: hypothetical protein H8E57_00945 [Candidatus Cloacimonetes bacterium]|nr:hypothetical protein [Candidatus Cloacimonadota bacterium]
MKIILLIIIILFLISCTAGNNSLEKTPAKDGESAGFWLGLWHGLISCVTFIISLFSDKIHFYEVHNNGNWYNFGFVLGAGILTSGTLLSRKRKK